MISLYPTRHASYASKYSLSDSVARLSDRVKKDNWRNRLRGGILGTVKPDEVILRYFRPLNIFSAGMRFHGSFVEKNGSTVLIGRFQVPKLTRMFSASWLAIAIILSFYSLIRGELLAVPLSMFILWIAPILIIRLWGRTDIDYVSRTVYDSLG